MNNSLSKQLISTLISQEKLIVKNGSKSGIPTVMALDALIAGIDTTGEAVFHDIDSQLVSVYFSVNKFTFKKYRLVTKTLVLLKWHGIRCQVTDCLVTKYLVLKE